MKLRNSLWVVAAIVATLVGATLPLRAQNQNTPISIALFEGRVGDAANIALSSWGSGKAEATRDLVLTGDSSIRITTQGLFQGGRLDFPNPVDLAPAFGRNDTYLRFRVHFTGGGSTQTRFDERTSFSNNAAASPFERMRFILVMADGTRYELTRPATVPPTDDPDAYVNISFPLAAVLKKNDVASDAPTGEKAKLKSIAIMGDKSRQFYLGEVSVITDATDITVSPLDDVVAFANDRIPFVGNAEGGASTLRYSWDFDARDGIQEDATGRSVNHVFTKSGHYKVTLTVTDLDGLKKPVTTDVELDVAE